MNTYHITAATAEAIAMEAYSRWLPDYDDAGNAAGCVEVEGYEVGGHEIDAKVYLSDITTYHRSATYEQPAESESRLKAEVEIVNVWDASPKEVQYTIEQEEFEIN